MSYTAHANSNGFVFLYNTGDYRTIVSEYGGDLHHIRNGEIVSEFLDDSEDYLQEERELLENKNFPGRTSNFRELAAAKVPFDIIESDGSFGCDVLHWPSKDGLSTNVAFIPSEERPGFVDEDDDKGSNDPPEPLTVGEAAWFIEKVLGPEYTEGATPEALKASTASFLQPLLQEVYNRIQACIEAMDDYNDRLGRHLEKDGKWQKSTEKKLPRFLALHKFLPEGMEKQEKEATWRELYRRLRITLRDDVIGGQWSYSSEYGIGIRSGITDIVAELSVQDRTPQQQYLDCDFSELYEKAKKTNLYRQLFDQNGKNRSWSENNLYLWRQSHDRERRFATLLCRFSKMDVELLRKYFSGPESKLLERYRQSVKECAPGPGRAIIDGRWQNAPLTGSKAVEQLIKRGFHYRDIHPEVRFSVGQHWHRLWLTKAQVDELQLIIDRRIAEADKAAKPVITMGEKLPPDARFKRDRDMEILRKLANLVKREKQQKVS